MKLGELMLDKINVYEQRSSMYLASIQVTSCICHLLSLIILCHIFYQECGLNKQVF